MNLSRFVDLALESLVPDRVEAARRPWSVARYATLCATLRRYPIRRVYLFSVSEEFAVRGIDYAGVHVPEFEWVCGRISDELVSRGYTNTFRISPDLSFGVSKIARFKVYLDHLFRPTNPEHPSPLGAIPTHEIGETILRIAVQFDSLAFRDPSDLIMLRGRLVSVSYARSVLKKSMELLSREEASRSGGAS